MFENMRNVSTTSISPVGFWLMLLVSLTLVSESEGATEWPPLFSGTQHQEYRLTAVTTFRSLSEASSDLEAQINLAKNERYIALIDASGFRDQIHQTIRFQETGLNQTVEFGLIDRHVADQLKAAHRRAFSEEYLERSMIEGLKIMEDRLGIFLENIAWYQSPLGKKVVALESASSSPEAYLKILDFSLQPLSSHTSGSRLALIRQLIAVLPDRHINGFPINSRFALNTLMAMRFRGTDLAALANPGDGLDRVSLPDSERVKSHYLAGMVYIYGDLSDQELREYIAYLSTPTGRNSLLALCDAFYGAAAVAQAGLELLIPEELRPQFESGAVKKGVVTKYGIYTATPTRQARSDGTTLGTITYVNNPILRRKTTQVPAELGTQFGIEYRLKGSPEKAAVNTVIRVTHPPITDSRTGKTSTVDEWSQRPLIGVEEFASWCFEYPWEIIPGEWTFEVLYEGRSLATKNFTVLPRSVDLSK